MDISPAATMQMSLPKYIDKAFKIFSVVDASPGDLKGILMSAREDPLTSTPAFGN